MKVFLPAVFLLAAAAGMARAEDPVVFADPNMQAAVEAALGKPNPTPTDMLAMQTLTATSKGIESLVGLEHAVNLVSLQVGYNKIITLEPLAALQSLESINIEYNQIVTIAPLSGLTKLNYLRMRNNSCPDITPVANLTNIEYINARRNGISDLSPVSGLRNLRRLYVYQNPISDLSPLSNLTNLQELWLHDDNVHDLSPISGLVELQRLGLNRNQVTDISPLKNMPRLYLVWLAGNHISDISSLSGLAALQSLQLHGNPLNTPAYCKYLDLIIENNPDLVELTFDPDPNPVSGDCTAGFEDIAYFAVRWLATSCSSVDGFCLGADLDHSGNVDLVDLSVLLSLWKSGYVSVE